MSELDVYIMNLRSLLDTVIIMFGTQGLFIWWLNIIKSILGIIWLGWFGCFTSLIWRRLKGEVLQILTYARSLSGKTSWVCHTCYEAFGSEAVTTICFNDWIISCLGIESAAMSSIQWGTCFIIWCVFLWGLSSHSRTFYSYWDVTMFGDFPASFNLSHICIQRTAYITQLNKC